MISLFGNLSRRAWAASYEEERKQPLELYEGRLEAAVSSITFGAFDHSKLVGIVTVVRENKLKLRHRSNIVSMYVTKGFRENGIGKALLEEALQHVRKVYQSEQLYLTVASINKAAKTLYSSAGFEHFGTDTNALKIDDHYIDVDHMVLYLKYKE
ncbi:GNAT family N-acetyltransferase [Halobacillus sp. A1]|uniref:GNAT family N-acetyltransferase n=1 Tax=Halobacillus sp. A1 TaxID=2880262 RepID=UPI002113B61B|nr:GNAT family N-acetyltransferase [Halobacillus sp. A1]MCP3033061.1 GNAT family N-acetyltransferase [Halobacillus sp. A1]